MKMTKRRSIRSVTWLDPLLDKVREVYPPEVISPINELYCQENQTNTTSKMGPIRGRSQLPTLRMMLTSERCSGTSKSLWFPTFPPDHCIYRIAFFFRLSIQQQMEKQEPGSLGPLHEEAKRAGNKRAKGEIKLASLQERSLNHLFSSNSHCWPFSFLKTGRKNSIPVFHFRISNNTSEKTPNIKQEGKPSLNTVKDLLHSCSFYIIII